MAQRGWGLPLSGQWGAVAASRWRQLLAALPTVTPRPWWAVAGFALALVADGLLRVRYLAGPAPLVDGEAVTIARAYAISHPGGAAPFGGNPLAAAQLAGYNWLTGWFWHAPTALVAARTAMVLVSLVSTALLWVLARRLELSGWAATGAAVLLAVSPLVLGLDRFVLPENIALVWVLAALIVQTGRGSAAGDALTALCLTIAGLTAPLALAVLPGVVALGSRRRHNAWVVTALVPGVVVLVALAWTFGWWPGLPPLSGVGFGVDPVLSLAVVVAVLIGVGVARVRPVAWSAAVLLVVAVWPGISAAVLLAPLGALSVAGVVDAATGHRKTGRHARARHGADRVRRAVPPVAALGLAATIPFWVAGLTALATGPSGSAAIAGGTNWLRANASGSIVLAADDLAWTELRRAGWSAVVTCDPACPGFDWLLSIVDSPGRAPAGSVAVFGAGPWRVTISPAHPAVASVREWDARRLAGAALLRSPRVSAGPEVAAELEDGQVDPRLVALIAAAAGQQPVRVAELPVVAGEEAAHQPRRQALFALSGPAAAALVRFCRAQQGVFRPSSVAAAAGGVLVSYPPVPPTGLLNAFLGS